MGRDAGERDRLAHGSVRRTTLNAAANGRSVGATIHEFYLVAVGACRLSPGWWPGLPRRAWDAAQLPSWVRQVLGGPKEILKGDLSGLNDLFALALRLTSQEYTIVGAAMNFEQNLLVRMDWAPPYPPNRALGTFHRTVSQN